MARRSPSNARYQKFQEPPGKTRKSAAAAKPSRKAVNKSAPSSGGAKGSRAPIDPPTPEFKRLRTRWWVSLLAGAVVVLISWGARSLDRPGTLLGARHTLGSMNISYAGLLSSVLLLLAYAGIIYAFYLDFAKMRPMRQAYLEEHSEKTAKPSKKDTSKT